MLLFGATFGNYTHYYETIRYMLVDVQQCITVYEQSYNTKHNTDSNVMYLRPRNNF